MSTLTPVSLSARITNRGSTAAPDLVVTFKADAVAIGTDTVTVPAGGDAFATIDWTPDVAGLVDISTVISAVPTGHHRDDNKLTEQRNIVDYPVPLVIIDNGHSNNVFQSGDSDEFKSDLLAHGWNWVEDTDGISAADLLTATLLVISDPGGRGADLFSEEEEQSVDAYVNTGGALLLAGESDDANDGNPDEPNAILQKIDGTSIRVNSDGTADETNHGGAGPGHVLWHIFPGLGDLFVYPEGIPVPVAAVQELPGGGRTAVWGNSDSSFSNSTTYVPDDGHQNEIYNVETICWLLDRPLHSWTVAQARADLELDDSPDNFNQLVWVEGTVICQ